MSCLNSKAKKFASSQRGSGTLSSPPLSISLYSREFGRVLQALAAGPTTTYNLSNSRHFLNFQNFKLNCAVSVTRIRKKRDSWNRRKARYASYYSIQACGRQIQTSNTGCPIKYGNVDTVLVGARFPSLCHCLECNIFTKNNCCRTYIARIALKKARLLLSTLILSLQHITQWHGTVCDWC